MKTTLIALLCIAAPLMAIAVSAAPPAEAPTAGTGETAKRLKSQSNLTKLGLAVTIYVLDHHGALPDDDRWTEELRPYLESKTVFHDPAAPAAQKWCYAYNRNLSHKLLSSLQSPPTTVLFFETTKNAKDTSDTGQSVPHPGWHSGGTIYAFADGSVKWFPDGTKLSYTLSGK